MGLLDITELTMAVSNEDQRRDDDVGNIVDRLRNDDAVNVPIELTDMEIWSNYVNEDLYEMDVKVREFLKKTRYQRQAKGGYRTTVPAVFSWIYGRQPGPSDGSACRLLHELLRYYCSSYTGRSTYRGKPVNRVYRFTKYASNSKRPYSLRLRMEESDGSSAVFRRGPNSDADKRSHRGRADREDGSCQAG